MAELTFQHIYHPPQHGSKRTILVLHGTGGDEKSLLPIAEVLDPAAGALSVRGKVLENGAPRFFRRLAEGVFDLEDLVFRTHELADFVSTAIETYQLDPKNIVAVGYSNGANIAASIFLHRPEVLSAGVLLRAMVPVEPADQLDLSEKHILISEGRFDPIVPIDNAERLAQMFRERGANVQLNWQDLDHRLARTEIDAARNWLGQA